MELTFTSQQMRDFLIKTDKYHIQIIPVTYHYHEYHDKLIEDTRQIEIAYPKEIPLDNFLANKTYSQILEWSLTSVFNRELQSKLLSL
jgi:regulatory protein YycH of two-component signal transduction system YycFG